MFSFKVKEIGLILAAHFLAILTHTGVRPCTQRTLWRMIFQVLLAPSWPVLICFSFLSSTTKSESTGYVINYCIALVG